MAAATSRVPARWRLTPGRLSAALSLLLAALTLDALLRPRGEFDYSLIRHTRDLDVPGLERVLTAVSGLTGTEGAVGIWTVALLAFLARRRWLEATLMLAFPMAGGINWALRLIVGRTRPDPDQVDLDIGRRLLDNDFQSFPSGHVVGAVLLYGFFFLLLGRVRNRWLRMGGRASCVAVIALSGVSRVWLAHHWAGDALAAYALGGLVLTGVVLAYRSMAPTAGHVPLVHAADIPHDGERRHAHALTSIILFGEGTATKIYNPGFIPRLAYWLSFQAPFAYAYNEDALRAGLARRNLAGKLTEHWYGRNIVAPALRVVRVDGRIGIESVFIRGTEPADHHAARTFLHDLADRFDAAGLPTWQIDPRQPRSLGNLIETGPGDYTIIDLESGMVSPLQSPRAWWRALRRAAVPMYDDVFFDVTRAYVAREAGAMREQHGSQWLEELTTLLDEAESAAMAWHGAEPRLWSRVTRVAVTALTWSRFPGWMERKATQGRLRAVGWLESEIVRWEVERRLDTDEAAAARSQVADPGVQGVLPHFGVCLVIAVALRFPLGSIARVSYVLLNMLGNTLLMLVRKRSPGEWRRAMATHSPLVLLVAALPGFGTFCYMASGPILRNHMVLRLGLDAAGLKVPFRLYERMGFRRVVAPPARRPVQHSVEDSA